MNLFKPRYDYVEYESHERAPQFPLYSYAVAALYKVFGVHDFLGRVVSALFAAASAVFLFLLASRFFDGKTAFLSGLAYCVIPLRVFFMRAFMPDSMAVFCFLAGLYFFLLWLDEEKFFPYGIAAALLLALVPLLKIAYLWLLVAPVFYVLQTKGTSLFKRAGVWVIFGIVASAFSGWYGWVQFGAERSAGFAGQMNKEMSLLKEWLDPGFWSAHFFSRFPELLTTYAGLVFFAAGAWKIRRERIIFPQIWFVSTVFYILMCGMYGRVHQYVSLPFAPVNALFIGAGMAFLWDRWRAKQAFAVLWILLVVSMPVHAVLRIKHWYKPDQAWVLRAREEVDKISPPKDLLFVASPHQPFFLYHLQRKGWAAPLVGRGLEAFEASLSRDVKFLFVPLAHAGFDWPALRPSVASRYARVYAGPDFELYDLMKKP
ncbi:MAG: hypothetical protein A2901_05785 [Elusimicrobia bacterium RIFCSPLOWO2_01_FULL_54_10]|nr:MAG: hypothetical protein A2901_05785 [Elusimicrobia bacterium RIFCSPLOWO2_01_FULL_54_10]